MCVTGSLACTDDDGAIDGNADEVGESDTTGDTEEAADAVVVVEVALGSGHSCARLDSGLVQCWGADGAGQLGNGEPLEDHAYPSTLTTLSNETVALSAGGGHSCALSSTGVMSCWGLDILGQLGNGDGRLDLATPAAVDALGSTFAAIAAGVSSTCAIDKDGSLWCWGGDWFEQVGDGEQFINPGSPVALTGQSGPAIAVDAEQRVSCALIESGEVQCWGYCWSGTIGIGQIESDDCFYYYAPDEPAQLSGPATAIAVGDYHACALLETGDVQCWGQNTDMQLGVDSDQLSASAVPIDVGLPEPATQLAAGAEFTCALLESSEVYCWGKNLDGQLGQGYPDPTGPLNYAPVAVQGLPGPVTTIAAGAWHSCAIIEGGELWCWGADHRGQLGDGPPFDRSGVPSQVLGLGEELEGGVEGPGIDACSLDEPPPGRGFIGGTVPQWSSFDQFGEAFDLCSLGGNEPIIVDISASWCPPCQSVAEWLAFDTGNTPLTPQGVVREQVEKGEIGWLTVLTEGPDSEIPVVVEDATNWHATYPNDAVIVAIDPNFELASRIGLSGYPSFAMIDEHYRWYELVNRWRSGDRFGP
nr:hypothetical protein [Pseudenhygromyxa sp. WMMC2535]